MAARTAIGVKNDGSLVFYTCDEAGNSEGLTLAQLAERMQALGCRTALNLDGGGSTAAGVTYPGYASGATANVPSDGKLRECANFIFLVRQKKDAGTASKLYLYPFGGYTLPGREDRPGRQGGGQQLHGGRRPDGRHPRRHERHRRPAAATVTVEPRRERCAATVTAAAGGLRASAPASRSPPRSTSITIKHEGKNTALYLPPRRRRQHDGADRHRPGTTAIKVYSADDELHLVRLRRARRRSMKSGTFTAVQDRQGRDRHAHRDLRRDERAPCPVTVGSSQPFDDTKGHWAESYITELYYAGTLQGSDEERQALLPPRRAA